ncbi:hypothetical protein AALB51_04475 [Lachnospiraceae bacterium 62-26]
MKKKWTTLFIIFIFFGILACLQWGNLTIDTITPNPRFAPLTQAPSNEHDSDYEIYYIQDGSYGFMYNIKDDPEKFMLEIVEG